MDKKDEQWALFWCTLLHPILFGEIGKGKVSAYLRKLSQQEISFPDGKRKKPALSTLKRKFKKYRKAGFNGLARKPRADQGKSRTVPQEMITKAIELKKDQPLRSHGAINQFLQQWYDKTISRSTLFRYLKQAGATKIKLDVTKQKVRKRWSRDHTHDLWVGDFEEGPYVICDGQSVPTHLSAFIDHHSRFIIQARYYYRQNLDILIDTLLRAWAVHGSSSQLYLDNAKVYHSNALKAACYRLNIQLIHRKAGDPAPAGIIERFFGTVQPQFEAEVRAGDILTLDHLNRAFSAWLEMSYHRRIHSEIGQTPQTRYQQGLRTIRHVDMEQAIISFMRSETRRVHKDFSDVQLFGRFYRVDKRLRGDKVIVRFDPFSTMDEVIIFSTRGEYLGKGTLHTRQEGEAPSVTSGRKPHHNYLDLLIQQHQQKLLASTRGIDFRKAASSHRWSFASFVKSFSHLLNRKGGLSSFTAGELETLKKAFNRSRSLSLSLLQQAFAKANQKTILSVLFELQQLLRLRRRTDQSSG